MHIRLLFVSRLRADQRGNTLLELLIAAAITGLIAAPTSAALFETFQTTTWGTQKSAQLGDLRNAATWLSVDIPLANSTDLPDGGPAQSSVVITFTDYYGGGSTAHQVSYALVGTELRRTEDGATHTVAWHVTAVSFLRSGYLVTVTLTTPSPSGSAEQTTYQFSMRSNS